MARLLTQTTDYRPSWDDILNYKTNGELSEAIEGIFSGYDSDMDSLVDEITLAIKDGYLKTLQGRIVTHFEDDGDLELECDTTRTEFNTNENP